MNTPPAAKATRREWIGLGVIALPCLLYSMDLTVLNLALPQLGADLEPSSVQLLWIVDIYGFLVAGSLITMGTLGDRIGRRRLLGSMLAPRLVRSFRAADVMAAGLAVAALGYLLLTQVSRSDGPGLLVTGMVLQSIRHGARLHADQRSHHGHRAT